MRPTSRRSGLQDAPRRSLRANLRDASMSGAVDPARPKMMTVTAIMAWLLPTMWSTGTGSEIKQRFAVPNDPAGWFHRRR
jgi:Cu(I)/Ag(I) efflux system membrane protein CusA/SilA